MQPLDYTLIVGLQTALRAMSVAGGYHFDVQASAVKLDPNCDVESLIAPGGLRPFVIIEVKPDTWEYKPAKRIDVVLPITIHWVSDAVPTDDESRLKTFFEGLADVERAIAKPITDGAGGEVLPRITKRSYSTAIDGAQVWAIVDTELRSHRVYGQPDA